MMKTEVLDDRDSFDRAYDLMPGFRRKRVDGLHNIEVKKQSLAVFTLLIRGLGDLGLDMSQPTIWDELGYTSSEHGKPRFSLRPDISFSMSHTHGAVLCAVSGSEIGCDIEYIKTRRNLKNVAERILGDDELSACMNGTDIDPEAFFRIWTAGEARAKYTGEGLQAMLVKAKDPHPVQNTYTCITGDHACAICTGLEISRDLNYYISLVCNV